MEPPSDAPLLACGLTESTLPQTPLDLQSMSLALGALGRVEQQQLYNWSEITDTFLAATKELTLGELLHDDLFGLFEAMSAIEMMDPKMDAGMRCNRQATRPHSFLTAVQAGHLKLDVISNAELIGVIDHCLACLVTWLEGHSLAQTVFTNLYLHNPFEITHPLMRAFSIATLKLVDVIKDIITKGNVYEEEDFQPLSYGFKLASEVSEQRVGGMLREVEDDLQKVLRSTKGGEERDEETLTAHEEAGALFSRIRFYRLIYQGVVALGRQDLVEGARLLSSAGDQVSNIAVTISLGAKPPAQGANMMGFERLANQRLLPPTFPRYTEIRTREEGVAYFKGLVARLNSALAVTQVQSFHSALEFFAEFSSSSPCVLSRSVLQVLYGPLYALSQSGGMAGVAGATSLQLLQAAPKGTLAFQELLRDACRAFIAPPSVILKTPPFNAKQVKDCIDAFFLQCCRPMGILLQAFGHNRARQRDKIASLLEEFSTIQEEADKLDTMLNAICSQSDVAVLGRSHVLYFSTWLLYHVLRLMVRYVLSGFELELYSAHEYPYLYWYLYELLFPWLSTCLHRADAHLLAMEQMTETHKNAGKSKKKVKSTTKRKPRPYAREVNLYQGYASMCSALFKLLVGLKKERKILIPNSTFDNECVRYERRFGPFANLSTPPLMPYGQYLEVYEATAANVTSSELFLQASRDFSRTRQFLETVVGSSSIKQDEEIATLISINKINFVAASVLYKDPTRKVEFDFSAHPTFPSVKIS